MSALSGVRVVMVNNFPGPGLGGGEVQNIAVCEGLLAEGAELEAVVISGSAFGARLEKMGAAVTEVPMSLASAPRAASAISGRIAPSGPTVLVGTGFLTNQLVRVAVRNSDACVVNVVGVTPGASLSDGGSRFGLVARRLADDATAARVDAYVAVAQSVAAGLVGHGAPAERVHTILNGVDAGALRAAATGPLPAGLPDARPLVVCAARLEAVKGVEFLVRAAAHLPDTTIAIAGDGPLEGKLREIKVALGVAGRVVLLGHVAPLAPLLAAADVVVLPSLSEGLPMVALEAMALARPVVATRVGGIPEAVEDGVTGLLVEPSDAPALAGAIERVTADAALAGALGAAGANAVEKRFSSARMVDQYVRLIAELANEQAR